MKRYLISILTLCMSAFCLHAQSSEFDPANPGDPNPAYLLQVQVAPSAGGSANIRRTMVYEGEQVYLRLYANDHFELQQWVCGDSVVSANASFYFTMPGRNVTLTAQMIYHEPQPEEFNPESPGDPQGQAEDAKRHRVTVYAVPSVGGFTNSSSFFMFEGEQRDLYAYANPGYEFVGWYRDNKPESQSNPVTITMQEQDIALTAQFRFNPASPEDPGTNLYDSATGTLIIDRFTPGNLSNVVYSLMGGDSYSLIRQLTIIGEMKSSDFGVVRYFNNIDVIDLSRTTGLKAIPSWAFEDLSKLQRLLLPSTIESIGGDAFYGCSALTEIVLYAPAPPDVKNNSFDGLGEEVVLRVPGSSLVLYSAREQWQRFLLMPMDVQALAVTIPEDKLAWYENMFLELLDTQTGQLRRYVITTRSAYAFANVFSGTTYQLNIRNAKGRSFAQETITLTDQDTTMVFSQFLRPVNVSIRIMAGEEDVTANSVITWLDNEGNYLNKGTTLLGQVEGDLLKYQISLDNSLGVRYKMIDEAISFVVDPEQSEQVYQLEPLSYRTLSGIVIDSVSNMPVKNASVVASQRINGKYDQTTTAYTADDGSFSLQVVDETPAQLVITASDYKKKSVENVLALAKPIALAPVTGSVITLRYAFTGTSLPDVISTSQLSIEDARNIEYTIYNRTKEEPITDFENNLISLKVKQLIDVGDSIEVTVSSPACLFAQVTGGGRIDEKNGLLLTFTLVELGGIQASYNAGKNDAVAMLYDESGKLIQQRQYSNRAVEFGHLTQAHYKLVTMERNTNYNGVSKLEELSALGLAVDDDYVLSDIEVVNGQWTVARIDSVPAIIEKQVDFFDTNTGLTVNKPSVVSGTYLTLRGKVAFKPEFTDKVSNVELLVDMPANASLVENAVMEGNALTDYRVEDDRLIVPVKKLGEQIRYCIIPTRAGEYEPTAYVRFTFRNEHVLRAIGSAHYAVENASISASVNYSDSTFSVNGMTMPYSTVTIFDNDINIGQVKASGAGYWSALCKINQPYNLSTHVLYAAIESPDGLQMQTQTSTHQLFYSNIALRTVKMKFYNAWMGQEVAVTWDYETGKSSSRSYSFYTETKFTFEVDFTNNSPDFIKEALVVVTLDNGRTADLNLKYKNGHWEASGVFGNNGLPVNVTVKAKFGSDISVDSQFVHNLFVNNSTESEEDRIGPILDEALANEDFETIEAILDSIFGAEDATAKEWTSQEIDALIAKSDSMIHLHDVDFISSDVQVIRDSLNTLLKGVTTGTCDGVTESQLVGEGFEVYPKDNGQNLYVYSSETKYEIYDFDENIHYSFDLTANGPMAAPMRELARMKAAGETDIDAMLEKFESIRGMYNKFNDLVQSLAGAISNIQSSFQKQNYAIAREQKELRDAQMSLQPSQADDIRKLRNKRIDNVKLWEKNRSRIKTVSKYNPKAIQVSKGFSILGIVATFGEGVNDGLKLYDLYKMTMPCPYDSANAVQIRQDIVRFGKGVAIYYAAQISAATAQFLIFETSLGLSLFTAGTSLAMAATAVTAIGLTYSASLIYDCNKDKAVEAFKTRIGLLECYQEDPKPETDPKDQPKGPEWHVFPPKNPPITPIIDPSGYVYEGITSNRLEGVKATAYYKETKKNVFGEWVDEEILWDAAEFDQENPLYTDADGMYHWDVPQGMWQVRFEKDGYEPTQSEWLPVPPPQLEVNIPMVQLRQPEVINAIARVDAIDIMFDRYMIPESLNSDNILVTANDKLIAGQITLLDEQAVNSDSEVTYATKLRFVPDAAFTAKEVTLTISNRVRSYADVPMAQTFQQTFDIEGAQTLSKVYEPTPSIRDGHTIVSGTELTLSCETEGATIRYTVDGSMPTCTQGILYTNVPIILVGEKSVVVYAMACADGYEPSNVVEWTYFFGEVEETGMDNALDGPQFVKILRDGQLLIRHGNKLFTVTGQEVK